MTIYKGRDKMVRYDLAGAVLARACRTTDGWITTADGTRTEPIPDTAEALAQLELDGD